MRAHHCARRVLKSGAITAAGPSSEHRATSSLAADRGRRATPLTASARGSGWRPRGAAVRSWSSLVKLAGDHAAIRAPACRPRAHATAVHCGRYAGRERCHDFAALLVRAPSLACGAALRARTAARDLAPRLRRLGESMTFDGPSMMTGTHAPPTLLVSRRRLHRSAGVEASADDADRREPLAQPTLDADEVSARRQHVVDH